MVKVYILLSETMDSSIFKDERGHLRLSRLKDLSLNQTANTVITQIHNPFKTGIVLKFEQVLLTTW